MSSLRTLRLTPNRQWPGLVDRMLGGTSAERAAARETLWVEVEHCVVRFVRLPIGPLADDLEVRRNIAVAVLRRLEVDDYKHLRKWRKRQGGPDGAAWWSLIWRMAQRLAIDAARGSRQNLALRGERYRWARVVSVDPAVFDVVERATFERSLEFLEQATEEELCGYLDSLQDKLGGGDVDESERGGGERQPELAPAPGKRKTNGGRGGVR